MANSLVVKKIFKCQEYTVEFGRAVEFHMMMGITRRSQSEVGR